MGLLSWLHLRNTSGRLRCRGRERPATPRFGGSIFMVFAIAAAVMGLIRFATQVSEQDQTLADADQPGGGIIVRSEMLHVWVSPTLVDLAKRQAESGEIQTHEDLRGFLELRSQIKLCYVVTMRGHQVDGNFADMPFVRQPYNDAEHFFEFLDVLAAVAENSWDEPTDLFSTVSVHIVPEKFAEPRDEGCLCRNTRQPRRSFSSGTRWGCAPTGMPAALNLSTRSRAASASPSVRNGAPAKFPPRTDAQRQGSVTSAGGIRGVPLSCSHASPVRSGTSMPEGHARDRQPPRWWSVLSLPMRGSYADRIHFWGGWLRCASERVRGNRKLGVESGAACE